MKLSRDLTLIAHFFFDQCVPPFFRDSKWFMYFPYKILFGSRMKILFEFKEKFHELSDKEIYEIYRQMADIPILHRDTDINKRCLSEIEKNIIGKSVLDIACGRGYLSDLLFSAGFEVTASDFIIENSIKEKYPFLKFQEADITSLPFKKKQFDTVICAHTLEHIRDIQKALIELRRVTRHRLIIIVPRQRPYKYTFDLHIHFFPYRHSFLQITGKTDRQQCSIVGGDLFYMEDLD